MTHTSSSLTVEDCRAYLADTVFRLQEPDYGRKCPPDWPGAVGLEVEMLPVMPLAGKNGKPMLLPVESGEYATARLLRSLAERRGWSVEEMEGADGFPLFSRVLLDDCDNLTFEPGGQLEFSSRPYPCLNQAAARVGEIQKILRTAFENEGVELVQFGINPWHNVDEVGLQMPKSRYKAQDRYYCRIGEFGRRMMRQTCTVQVNLDFGPSEEILAKRYLASCLIAPFASATFAYSGLVDGAVAGYPGYRSLIWRHTDPTRTGFPDLTRVAARLDKDSCVSSFLDFSMQANVIYLQELEHRVPDRKLPFGEWLQAPVEGVSPKLSDLIIHLSLLFPEVRPRGFLELRSVDCQSSVWQTVPAAYFIGLIYEGKTLDAVLELLLPKLSKLNDLLNRSCLGMGDTELAPTARRLMTLAQEGLSRLPDCFKEEGCENALLAFSRNFTHQGRTPGDELVAEIAARGDRNLTLGTVAVIEDRWRTLVT